MPSNSKEYARKWREENRERTIEYTRRHRQENPGEYNEYMRNYHRANIISTTIGRVRAKKRPRPDNVCEVCSKYTTRLEYHHWDTSHPSLGLWLCRRCHYMAEAIDDGLHDIYLQEKKDMVLISPS